MDGNIRKSYLRASFVLAAVPLAVLICVFVFCLVLSGGHSSDNDEGAIWWLLIGAAGIFVPVAIVTGILSVIFGVKGLKGIKGLRENGEFKGVQGLYGTYRPQWLYEPYERRGSETVFAWAGIAIVALEILAGLIVWLWLAG